MKKKLLALLLCVVMVASMLPTTALAAAAFPDSFRVRYREGSETPKGQTDVAFDETFTIEDNIWFEKAGYEFTGWNTKADGTGVDYVPGDCQIETDDLDTAGFFVAKNGNYFLDLYPQWDELQYRIIWNPNDEGLWDGTSPNEVKAGDRLQSYSKSVRSQALSWTGWDVPAGYTFGGWTAYADNADAPDEDVFWRQMNPENYIYQPEYEYNDDSGEYEVQMYARWLPETYYGYFYPNNGEEGVQETEQIFGQPIDFSNVIEPEYENYVFAGWFTDPDDGVEVDDTTIWDIAGNADFYAHWDELQYRIIWNPNDEDLWDGTSPNEVKAGAGLQPYSKSVRSQSLSWTGWDVPAGYTFGGWTAYADNADAPDEDVFWRQTDPENYIYQPEYEYNDDSGEYEVQMYARWLPITYTGSFYDNNGTDNVQVTEQTFGMTVDFTDVVEPEYEGYTFCGWFDSIDTEVDEDTVWNYTEDTDFFAGWKANEYTVTFHENYGSDATTEKVQTYNEEVVLADAPEREGYIFQGWFTAAEGGEEVADGTVWTDTEITDLYAQWLSETYYVIWVNPANGKEVKGTNAQTYDKAFKVRSIEWTELGSDFIDAGYDFIGWTESADGMGKIYSVDDDLDTNDTVKNLAYTFDADLNANVAKLYAKTKATSFDITFDAQGGEEVTGTYTVTYGQPYGTLPTTTKTGFSFIGWSETPADSTNTIQTSDIFAGTEAPTLYAQWKASTFGIKFDGNTVDDEGAAISGTVEGSMAPLTNLSSGVSFAYPECEFTLTGYSFQGWDMDDDGEVDFAPDEDLITVNSTEDVTFKAVWKQHTYSILWKGNGGLTDGTVEDIPADLDEWAGKVFKYSDSFKARGNKLFVNPGYTIKGWAYDADADEIDIGLSEKVTKLTDEDGAVITLYAVWEENVYTINYDANAAEGGAFASEDIAVSETCGCDTEYTVYGADAVVNDTQTFMGWDADEDGEVDYEGGAAIDALTFTSSSDVLNLVAVWAKDLSDTEMASAADVSAVYNGTNQTVPADQLDVEYNGEKLECTTEYLVYYFDVNDTTESDEGTWKPWNKTVFNGDDYKIVGTYPVKYVAVEGSGYVGEIEGSFEITPAEVNVSLKKDNAQYTGEKLDDKIQFVIEGLCGTDTCSVTDYTVAEGDIINVGTYTISDIVLDNENYIVPEGTTLTFTVKPRDISKVDNCTIILTNGDPTYTGEAAQPKFTITHKNVVKPVPLVEGVDYTVECTDVDAGPASAVITGIGNFKGTRTYTFTIQPVKVSELTDATEAEMTFTGEEFKPVVILWGDVELVEGTDYDVVYENNRNAGTASYTVTCKGNFFGTIEGTFVINKQDLSNAVITFDPAGPFTYDGTAQKPNFTVADPDVIDEENDLDKGVDFTTKWPEDKKNVGTKTLTITAKKDGNYTGTATIDYEIVPLELEVEWSFDGIDLTYCGGEIYPLAILKTPITGDTVAPEYSPAPGYDCTSAGTQQAMITLKNNELGNYVIKEGDELSPEYTIEQKSIEASTVTISVSETEFQFDGTDKIPEVVVTDTARGVQLIADEEYEITWADDAKPNEAGVYTMTVSGIGNYTDSVDFTITVWTYKADLDLKKTNSRSAVAYVRKYVPGQGEGELIDLEGAKLVCELHKLNKDGSFASSAYSTYQMKRSAVGTYKITFKTAISSSTKIILVSSDPTVSIEYTF